MLWVQRAMGGWLVMEVVVVVVVKVLMMVVRLECTTTTNCAGGRNGGTGNWAALRGRFHDRTNAAATGDQRDRRRSGDHR